MDEGRVALVTGCSSGIGRAVARELAARGWRCFATARRPADLAELEAEGTLLPLAMDVTDDVSVRTAVTAAVGRAGGIDLLVNNAGSSLFGALAETPIEDVERLLAANVTGALRVIQAVFPHMAERGHGRIVNVGSLVGVVPTPWTAAYCGSKAALHAMSEALRLELEPFGIELVVVQPGAVRSAVADKAPVHAKTSRYAPWAEQIERRSRASQQRPMEAEVFARRMVDAVTAERPPRTVRIGGGARAISFLARLPRPLRDAILRRVFGLG